MLALTAGTLYYARFCRDVPLLPGTTVQFLSASAVCAAATCIFETPHAAWTGTSVAALLWNAGPVSFGGMALYFVMLARGTAARTRSNFYLVPGVTALMAWLFLGERLSSLAVSGLITASTGCSLVSAPGRDHGRRRFTSASAPCVDRRISAAPSTAPKQRAQTAASPGGQLRDA